MPVYVLNIYSDTPDDFTVYNTIHPVYTILSTLQKILKIRILETKRTSK